MKQSYVESLPISPVSGAVPLLCSYQKDTINSTLIYS